MVSIATPSKVPTPVPEQRKGRLSTKFTALSVKDDKLTGQVDLQKLIDSCLRSKTPYLDNSFPTERGMLAEGNYHYQQHLPTNQHLHRCPVRCHVVSSAGILSKTGVICRWLRTRWHHSGNIRWLLVPWQHQRYVSLHVIRIVTSNHGNSGGTGCE